MNELNETVVVRPGYHRVVIGLEPEIRKFLLDALRDIGLALNVVHNTVTTDIPGIEPNETSWRVDHSKEISLVNCLENTFKGIDNDHELRMVNK